MREINKAKIIRSVRKIIIVLFFCGLFFQLGKIPMTNALLRDKASAQNNSFTAGTWGDSLGLEPADAVIEEVIEAGILTEEEIEEERAFSASPESTEPIVEAPSNLASEGVEAEDVFSPKSDEVLSEE